MFPPDLRALAAQLEAQKARGLALLDGLDPELARRRPARGGWSVLECLAHLNKTAEASLRLTDEATRGVQPLSPPPERYPVRWWLRLFLRTMEPPVRLKTRTRRAFVPPETLEPAQVASDFAARHDELRAQLDGLAGLPLAALRVRSPFASWLRYSLYEWWLLLLAHERRHLWQAEQALAEVGGEPA